LKRKIAVVTGTRAEYGILIPLLEKIKHSPKLQLKLIVTGMHLQKKYGLTYKQIKSDGFLGHDVVHMYNDKKIDHIFHARGLGKAIEGFASVLSKIKPDIVVITGDRLEALSATLAASTLNIPVAHIHGGDSTDSGHIDESFRHAISQFAHIHFPATETHSRRLIKMGQQPWRVNRVGALGLDSILRKKLISKKELFHRLNIKSDKKTAICIFHPVQLEIGKLGIQMSSILKTLRNFELQTVIIYPNNDLGSREILSVIKKYEKEKNFKIFANLSHLEYISLLKYSDVLIGNSSSGIIEAPSLGIPVINVGTRNLKRESAKNVIFVKAQAENIKSSLKKSLYDTGFRQKAMQCLNPYGNGKASDKILRKLIKIKIDKKLMKKIITI